jgi:acetolactate synthase-like protein
VSETDRLGETLLRAKRAALDGHPVLVNALVGKTDFRKGSISI